MFCFCNSFIWIFRFGFFFCFHFWFVFVICCFIWFPCWAFRLDSVGFLSIFTKCLPVLLSFSLLLSFFFSCFSFFSISVLMSVFRYSTFILLFSYLMEPKTGNKVWDIVCASMSERVLRAPNVLLFDLILFCSFCCFFILFSISIIVMFFKLPFLSSF